MNIDYEVNTLINELVRGVDEKIKEKGLEFKVAVNPKLPSKLYGDAIRITQILMQILEAGMNDTQKGFITMSVQYEEAEPDAVLLKVRIADTGSGIVDAELKDRVMMEDSQFDYTSVNQKGSIFSFQVRQKVVSREPVGVFRAVASAHQESADDIIFKQLNAIAGIDTQAGIQACGTKEIYLSVVREFYPPALKQAEQIEQYSQEQDYHNYTIVVHALKSSARLIGALELSEQAKQLEASGNAKDQQTIEAKTPPLLQAYRIYAKQLQSLFEKPEEDAAKPLIEEKMLKEAMEALCEMAEAFDFDSADAVMETLTKYRMPETFQSTYRELKTFMAQVARDDMIELIKRYLNGEEH